MASVSPTYRITSIDLLKGLVMVVMALDHVRDFFHAPSFYLDVTDPAVTTPAIFFTRWITHFCAPTFSLLAGLSAYLAGRRKTRPELSRFLLSRGIWLILLEMTVVAFAWMFNPHFPTLIMTTLWALGISMIMLSALIWLPVRGILVFSLAIILGHDLLDGLSLPVLHTPFIGPLTPSLELGAGYPILPWIAVMPLGYCLGPLYGAGVEGAHRRRVLVRMGLGSLILFGLLITLNLYGDPAPWHTYPTVLQSVESILNRSKYPPSLEYLLMTLGPALLMLAATEKARGRWVAVISTYGRVPFFYYILHIYLIHLLALGAAEATGHDWHILIMRRFDYTPVGTGYGFGLPVVYAVWVFVVVALYPLCAWFDRVKQTNKHLGWLSYL